VKPAKPLVVVQDGMRIRIADDIGSGLALGDAAGDVGTGWFVVLVVLLEADSYGPQVKAATRLTGRPVGACLTGERRSLGIGLALGPSRLLGAVPA
jgi:hypothetical protein